MSEEAAEFRREMEIIEHMLDERGVTDDYLPPDIVMCGCEAEQGSMHLAWHLEQRSIMAASHE